LLLGKHRLDPVLIGNAAAALQGSPVTTLDLHYMFRRAPGNLTKLKRIAADVGGMALLEEAQRLVNRFVAVSQAAASSRLAHVGANADLTAVTSEIMELIDRIDRLHRHRFRADRDALAAWESAKNVLGPFRRRNGPPSEPSAGAVTPAATPPVEADGAGRTAA
jgi:hypothetical protein